ncbi:hypothetical protein SDC9_170285 [bioreactor metagenome]|uniref:Uncharacterized protein n=1 Tax=bioreactor metagenome TaxID=1076179 RepID=A0A645GA43_9ZZZZ
MLLQLFVHLRLHRLVATHRITGAREAKVDALGNIAAAEVGGHHDDGVLEVDDPALRIGQATLVQDLQQRVEDIRMCLLDLVEQDHAERLAANLLGQLPALFVSDIAGRRPEHPRSGVLLGVLAHVEGDQRILIAE